jgi:hypothetical protein
LNKFLGRHRVYNFPDRNELDHSVKATKQWMVVQDLGEAESSPEASNFTCSRKKLKKIAFVLVSGLIKKCEIHFLGNSVATRDVSVT